MQEQNSPATPNEQMVQDVAEAIAEALPDLDYDHDMDVWYWPNHGSGTWPLARAAIDAARPHIIAEWVAKAEDHAERFQPRGDWEGADTDHMDYESLHGNQRVPDAMLLTHNECGSYSVGKDVADWLRSTGSAATREGEAA